MSAESTGNQTVAQRNRQLLVRLGVVVTGMFLFAVFVMPPIYDAFCELTGLNGKTSGKASAASAVVDKERQITVEFLVDTDKGLPWDFTHETPTMAVHPGEISKTMFAVRNRASDVIVGRAVPSISPNEAAKYFRKTECFCFEEQRLEGGARKAMPMIFYIDPAIPKHITTVTLSYKFYNLTNQAIASTR
jgi:cytochrome c oxidase assembly protein subunit 11